MLEAAEPAAEAEEDASLCESSTSDEVVLQTQPDDDDVAATELLTPCEECCMFMKLAGPSVIIQVENINAHDPLRPFAW